MNPKTTVTTRRASPGGLMKRVATVAVMAACISVSLAAVATAHTAKHDSTITFIVQENGAGDDTFEGRVRSDNDRCAADRLVLIFREVAEGRALVGEDRTNADGEYRTPAGDVTGNAQAGTYYAVATRKVLRQNEDHTHVCKRELSTKRTVAGPEAPEGPEAP